MPKRLKKEQSHVRACYNAFLRAAGERKDLWQIALMEYMTFPLEYWREEPDDDAARALPIPVCFAHLAPQLPALLARKQEICPGKEHLTVQENLLREYDPAGDGPRRRLPAAALAPLLDYYLLADLYGGEKGWQAQRALLIPAEGQSVQKDLAFLSRLVLHSAAAAQEKKALADHIDDLFLTWWDLADDLNPEKDSWAYALVCELLWAAFREGEADAGLRLYQKLTNGSEAEKAALETYGLADALPAPEALLARAAQNGSAGAQVELGSLFVRRAGPQAQAVPPAQIVRWLEGQVPSSAQAAFLLGRIFLEGRPGLPADPARAVRALRAQLEAPRPEGADTSAYDNACKELLAECYAAGRGAPQDRPAAAALYAQLPTSHGFLYSYYTDGADTAPDPRAAVRYWMRDKCNDYRYIVWNGVLRFCTAENGAALHLWTMPINLLPGKEVFLRRKLEEEIQPCAKADHAVLQELLHRERVRLLHDAAQNGDACCQKVLNGLLKKGAATQEMLDALRPDPAGVLDWTDDWYAAAQARIAALQAQSEPRRYDEADLCAPGED